MLFTEKSQLLSQHAAAVIPATVVVPKDHRHGVRQRSDPFRQAKITITEITHEQNSIRSKCRQQSLISSTPGAVQITGNGKSECRQKCCLG